MALASDFLLTFRSRLTRKLASPQSRFTLAISYGFTIVAAGTLTIGVATHSGFADSIFGSSMSFFGGGDPAPSPAPTAGPGSAGPIPRRSHGHHARRAAPPIQLARKSMCVRLCDGFAFPVGDYHGDRDRPLHEATCHAECPGARTALYVMPAGTDAIKDASQVESGASYADLPDAFHYTKVLSSACTCHGQDGSRIRSILHDFTLRRGDAVMTAKGVRIFRGGGGDYPFHKEDFVALSKSKDVRRETLATLHAMEKASLVSRPAPESQRRTASRSPLS